jgi:hypothetical protein
MLAPAGVKVTPAEHGATPIHQDGLTPWAASIHPGVVNRPHDRGVRA